MLTYQHPFALLYIQRKKPDYNNYDIKKANAYQIANENLRPLPKCKIPNKAATAVALIKLAPKSGINAPRNRSSYPLKHTRIRCDLLG